MSQTAGQTLQFEYSGSSSTREIFFCRVCGGLFVGENRREWRVLNSFCYLVLSFDFSFRGQGTHLGRHARRTVTTSSISTSTQAPGRVEGYTSKTSVRVTDSWGWHPGLGKCPDTVPRIISH